MGDPMQNSQTAGIYPSVWECVLLDIIATIHYTGEPISALYIGFKYENRCHYEQTKIIGHG